MFSSQSKIRKITLLIHFRDEEIPLIIYGGTSEQAIHEHIRDLTNLYRFRCLNKKGQPVILSSNLPDKTHVHIRDPNEKELADSDEPSPEEQIDYLKTKTRELLDAKNVLNTFKAMLISLEAPPPKDAASPDAASDENKDDNPKDEHSEAAADGDSEQKQDTKPATEDDAKADDANPTPDGAEKQNGGDAAASNLNPADAVPDRYQYDGKYKELISEIEGKLDQFQSVIMEVYNVSDDLLPPKEDAENGPNPLAVASGAADGDEPEQEVISEEKREELLVEKVVAKLGPNMAAMQQLIEMQQMAVLTMMRVNASIGGGGGGGAVGVPMMAGGGGAGFNLPVFGGAALSAGPPAGDNAASKAEALPQSATEEAVEEQKVDRTADCKEWFKSSDLIEDDEYSTMMSFFDDDGAGIKSMECIYTASQSNYDCSVFHNKCDDVGPTLVLIQSEHGHIFGGFTKESWRDTSGPKGRAGTWKEDKDAWIFLLRSPKDDVMPEHWKILPEKKERTICGNKAFGPTFGYGYDIRVCNRCNSEKQSSSQLDNDDACFGAPRDDDYLTGEFYFKVKEYEVYKVKL